MTRVSGANVIWSSLTPSLNVIKCLQKSLMCQNAIRESAGYSVAAVFPW